VTSKQFYACLEFLAVPSLILAGMVCCRRECPGERNFYVRCMREANAIKEMLSITPDYYLSMQEGDMHVAIASAHDNALRNNVFDLITTRASKVLLRVDKGRVIDPWGNPYVIDFRLKQMEANSHFGENQYFLSVSSFGVNGKDDKGSNDDIVIEYDFVSLALGQRTLHGQMKVLAEKIGQNAYDVLSETDVESAIEEQTGCTVVEKIHVE